MSKQFVVTTPKNPTYSGKTCGVLFQGGRAFVSEFTIDQSLGLTVEEVIEKMREDFGYEIEQVGGAKLDLMDEQTIVVEPVAETNSASKKRLPASA